MSDAHDQQMRAEYRRQTQEAIRNNSCPFCGARAGDPCLSKRSMEMPGVHSSRRFNDA